MTKRAFLFGDKVRGLQYCREDVALMRSCLTHYSFEDIQEPNFNKLEISSALEVFVQNCGEIDTVIIYFSGHAFPKNSQLQLVVGPDINDISNRLSLGMIKECLKDCPAKVKLLILDCCHGQYAEHGWEPNPSDYDRILTSSRVTAESKELSNLKASFLTYSIHQLMMDAPTKMVSDKGVTLNHLYDALLDSAKKHNSTNTIQVPLPSLLGNQGNDVVFGYPVGFSQDERELASNKQAYQKYYRVMFDNCRTVSLRGLPQDKGVAKTEIKLEDIYIPLRFSADWDSNLGASKDDKNKDLILGRSPNGENASLKTIDSSMRDEPQEWLRTQKSFKSRSALSIGELLSEDATLRLIILGDPGCGKSTFLNWLTVSYILKAQNEQLNEIESLPDPSRIPILIKCRDFAPTQIPNSIYELVGHTIRNILPITDHDALYRLILADIEQNRSILLIDGLDEINDSTARIKFSQFLQSIAISLDKLPVIITSRKIGYQKMRFKIQEGFKEVTVQSLSKNDKDKFVVGWCNLTEKPEARKEASEQLIKAIHSSHRLEELTNNALQLTAMALLKRSMNRLPRRREELYGKLMEMLFNFNQHRFLETNRLEERDAYPQLEYISYEMTRLGDKRLNEDQILDILDAMRLKSPRRSIEQRTPSEVLHIISSETGILDQRGQDIYQGREVSIYAFGHLSYQEFFAGRALWTCNFSEYRKPNRLVNNILSLFDDVTTETHRILYTLITEKVITRLLQGKN